MEKIKSPIFYMGGKYDLLDELLPRFPKKEQVETFIDLFGGSGTISLNVPYNNIIYNEINNNIVNLLIMLKNNNSDDIIKHIEKRVAEFDLPKISCDIRVKHYTELYKIKSNKSYLKFREFYNNQKIKDYKDLFTLTFFSFCNLIRFNSKSEFNMPFGNRCFLEEHKKVISSCNKILNNKNITFKNKNAFEILDNIKEYNDKIFIYIDPPYTNTTAIYNEQRAFGGWSIEDDFRLFDELDRLNKLGIKWCMSNVLEHKGKENNHIKQWADKNGYEIIYLEDKQYASLGKGNANSKEIIIVNYETPYKKFSIFDFIEQEKEE